MGILDWMRSLFSGSREESDQDAIYLYLKCSACGEKLKLRISRQFEMSQDYESGGAYVRKVAVGQRCFRPIEVELRLEASGKEAWRSANGAQFVTREEYEAETRGEVSGDARQD